MIRHTSALSSIVSLLLLFLIAHQATTSYAYCADVHGCYSCVSTNYQVDSLTHPSSSLRRFFSDQSLHQIRDFQNNDAIHRKSHSSSTTTAESISYQCGWCDISQKCLLVESLDSHRPCFQSPHTDSCHSGCTNDPLACTNCSSLNDRSWMTDVQNCPDWQITMQLSNFGFFLVGSLSLFGSSIMIISIIVASMKQWPRSFIANRLLIYLGISDILLSFFCMGSSLLNWASDLGLLGSNPESSETLFNVLWSALSFIKNASYTATNLWSVALALSLTLSCTRWGMHTNSTKRFWIYFEILSHVLCWGIALLVGLPALTYHLLENICIENFCIVRIRFLILALIPIVCSLINIIFYVFILRTIHNSHSKIVRSGNVKRAAELMVFFRLSFLLLPAFIVNATQVMVYFLLVLNLTMPLWMNVVDSVCLPLQGLANAVLYALTTERFRVFLSRILPSSKKGPRPQRLVEQQSDLSHTPLTGSNSLNAIDELDDER